MQGRKHGWLMAMRLSSGEYTPESFPLGPAIRVIIWYSLLKTYVRHQLLAFHLLLDAILLQTQSLVSSLAEAAITSAAKSTGRTFRA
jgi:hypothetical protein